MGEFQKKSKTFNDILHDLPQIVRNKGDKILEETVTKHIDAEYKTLYVPLAVVEETKKDIGDTKWLIELKEYVLKHSPKLKENAPIFSARHFAKKIDEHKETLERWFS